MQRQSASHLQQGLQLQPSKPMCKCNNDAHLQERLAGMDDEVPDTGALRHHLHKPVQSLV
eukprot:1160271-Pelagomonas_calceolata.AAC.5